jgi:hypothetical protein
MAWNFDFHYVDIGQGAGVDRGPLQDPRLVQVFRQPAHRGCVTLAGVAFLACAKPELVGQVHGQHRHGHNRRRPRTVSIQEDEDADCDAEIAT